jgi:hypothetical protein
MGWAWKDPFVVASAIMLVPPGRQEVVAQALSDIWRLMTEVPPPTLYFTDAAGRHWRRLRDGSLQQMTRSATDSPSPGAEAVPTGPRYGAQLGTPLDLDPKAVTTALRARQSSP